MDQSKILPAEGFVRLNVILKVMPICKATWYKRVKNGEYPKGIKLSDRVTAWHVEDIRKLIAKLNEKKCFSV